MKESFSKRKRKLFHGFSNARGDMISKLPDCLITQILSYLPTKEVVRTSVLSKRWEKLWLLNPGLDLDTNEFTDYMSFVGFVDKFLDFCKEEKSCVHNLKLGIRSEKNDLPCVMRWIDVVATPKLKHLDVECHPVHPESVEVLPASLYICESLVYLRLHLVYLDSFESVSLPRLKTMRLERNEYANETCLGLLISSCPVLEDLIIVRRVEDGVKVLRVHSQTLTSLTVGFYFGKHDEKLSRFDTGNSVLSIDAPRLKYLNIGDEPSDTKIISNLDSLAKVDFAGLFDVHYQSDGAGLSKNQMARDFFTGISRVRDMIISERTMEFLYFYLQVEPLPQFCNMSCLEASLGEYNGNILLTILESCPNLKSIVLDLTHFSTCGCGAPSFVPQCLSSSLEFVEIKSRFTGRRGETEVAKYFVKNSVVLKKLLVHVGRGRQQHSLVALRDLLALSKPSSACQIVYVVDDDC